MSDHQCDPSASQWGGLLTLTRGVDAILESLNAKPPATIASLDDCPRCRVQLVAQLAASVAAVARERDGANAVMFFEMYRANIQSAIDQGGTEIPRDGF